MTLAFDKKIPLAQRFHERLEIKCSYSAGATGPDTSVHIPKRLRMLRQDNDGRVKNIEPARPIHTQLASVSA